ncbi:monoamine oxidase [Zafaria cholistanensis]|uniref:Monoamine oxidase n=1 Tax=Zafaria cholistanensis TaxID=1682741 RepID=A0A5A7NSI9_9MICC|nr:FAD-dependent oxidoreductase [Zafaria cholistanensis]GER23884.1 monoamine oxidase [Zafaria cholistanensis]
MSTAHVTCDVVVIGAGIAGLAAADTLIRAGRTVTVLEGRDRVGGRTLSMDAGPGAIDLGATWFWANEPHIRALADQLGVGTFPQYLEGDALFEADGSGARRLTGNPIDVPSRRFHHGAQVLAHGLASRLTPGILRLGDPVSALTVTGDRVHVLARSGIHAARHVILALPPALTEEGISFDPPLPEEVRDIARNTMVWMGSTVKTVAVYEAPFWREHGLSGSAISYHGPFREVHDHAGPAGSFAALFGFAPAARFAGQDTADIEAAFRDQLVRMFGPAARNVREIQTVDWSREPFTTPSSPSHQASAAHYGSPAFQRPVHHRIHWASTETATECAGHLEGALRAAMQAAHTILNTPVSGQKTPTS